MESTNEPIILITHPRSCSTAFERSLMTRRDVLRCLNEPFADPCFFGPEAHSQRYRIDGKNPVADGFEDCTFASRVSLIEKEHAAEKGKRAFFKDMALALVMPNDKAPSLAPSFEKPPGSEPDNPTVLPFEVLKTYRWTFIIRHPRSSIPSLYRLSMPASGEATGWHYYLPQEAGYRELRVLFDYLLSHKLIEPNHVCLIDADDLIAQPAKIIERYCKYIGIDYRPEMLRWNTEEDKAHADEVFASPKWIAFHRDALESTGFYARKEIKRSKTTGEEDLSWREEFGEEGAAAIRKTVDANIQHYEYLKKFATIKV